MLEDRRTVTIPYREYENMVKSMEEKDKVIKGLMEELNNSDKKVIHIMSSPWDYIRIEENGEEVTNKYIDKYIDSMINEYGAFSSSKSKSEEFFEKFKDIVRRRLEDGSFITRTFTNNIMRVLYDGYK